MTGCDPCRHRKWFSNSYSALTNHLSEPSGRRWFAGRPWLPTARPLHRRRVLSTMHARSLTRAETSDALDDRNDLIVHERWPAADAVPAQQDLHCDRSIHTVPQQMPGQGRDRVVTFTRADALPDEPTPIGDRMPEPTRLVGRQLEHPVRQGRQMTSGAVDPPPTLSGAARRAATAAQQRSLRRRVDRRPVRVQPCCGEALQDGRNHLSEPSGRRWFAGRPGSPTACPSSQPPCGRRCMRDRF